MIRSAFIIKKTNFWFDDAQKLLDELISDVTIDQWEHVSRVLLELEYNGTILHTYPVFEKETSELSQVFATSDLTTFQEHVYNSTVVKDLLMTARKKGWQIRIENS